MSSNPSALRQKIETLQIPTWQSQDKEKIAILYIKLAQAEAINNTELAQAAKYCHTAAYAAIHGTSNLENVILYTEYARFLNNESPQKDPLLPISTLIAEAIALRKLNKPWIKQLRLALRKRKIAQTQEVPQKKLAEKEVLLLWGLGLHFEREGKKPKAINLIKQSIKKLEKIRTLSKRDVSQKKTKKQIKAEKILGVLQINSGHIQEGIKTINNSLANETDPIICRDLAMTLLQLKTKETTKQGEIFLERAKTHFLSIYNNKGAADLKTFYLLLKRAANGNNLEEAEFYYNAIQQQIEAHQKKFLFPDNLEGFLGDFDTIYEIMALLYIKNNKTDCALNTISQNFWNTSQLSTKLTNTSRRSEIISSAALNGINNSTAIPDPFFDLKKGELHITLFNCNKQTIRIIRDHTKKIESSIIAADKKTIKRECLGIRSAAESSSRFYTLYKTAINKFRQSMFGDLSDILTTSQHIFLTATDPLNSIPWHDILPLHTLSYRLGIKYQGKIKSHTNQHILSVTENGNTLKMAPIEKLVLIKEFPIGSHITPPKETKEKILKSLEQATLFHFAGHGYTNNTHPEKSGLILFGALPIDTEEAIIYLREIEQLNLSNLKLAFLNSCASGYGPSYAGEIQSHAAASFLKAGTQNLIVSLRSILDSKSARFTEIFYTLLHQEPDTSIEYIFHKAACKARIDNNSIPYLFIKG